LHIHSALSACGDDIMSPQLILEQAVQTPGLFSQYRSTFKNRERNRELFAQKKK